MEDQDYLDLQKRVKELKMQELFEEPSSYEDDDDDDGGTVGRVSILTRPSFCSIIRRYTTQHNDSHI